MSTFFERVVEFVETEETVDMKFSRLYYWLKKFRMTIKNRQSNENKQSEKNESYRNSTIYSFDFT